MGFSEGRRRCGFRASELLERVARLACEAGPEGIGWTELLARADPEDVYAERTIEGAVRDLCVFGLLWRKGNPPSRGKPDGRRIVVTDLGGLLLEASLFAPGPDYPFELEEVPPPWARTRTE